MPAIANRRDADQHPDDGHRIGERAGPVLLGDAAADQSEDQLAAPDRALEREGDGEADVDQMRRAVRQVGVIGDDVGGGEDHERDAGLGEDPADHRPPAETVGVARDGACPEISKHQHDCNQGEADDEADQQPVAILRQPWKRSDP